jgi:hypothetical protein
MSKGAILGFLSIAIVCVTALIIWNDYKGTLNYQTLEAESVEKIEPTIRDYRMSQKEALDKLRMELQLKEETCIVNWETGEAWARIDLNVHRKIECNVNRAKRVKSEVISYLKEKLESVKAGLL